MNSSNFRKKRSRSETSTLVKDDDDDDTGDIQCDSEQRIATRDCHDLYAVTETVQCAMLRNCTPCAYKVAAFDVALDTEFCNIVPNQRPELCPRSVQQQRRNIHSYNTANNTIKGPPMGYQRGMYVLTIGDGDFSFSLALARFGCSVVATSYESEDTVRTVYSTVHVADNINELKALNAQIYYNVDATNIYGTLPLPATKQRFQRIVWNFPCSAVAKGQDGQNIEMEHNKNLVRTFMKNSYTVCCNGGQIYMNHKTKPPFNQWNIDEVAVSNNDHIRYLYRVVLDRNMFPPYVPRKALDRKSFPCHDACTYVFEVTDGTTMQNDIVSIISSNDQNTIDETSPINDSVLENLSSSKLLKVTPCLIQQIRTRLIQQHTSTSAIGKKSHQSSRSKRRR